ncbi:MAG: ABC transporter permease [Rhodospirillaceae bacterium]
MAGFILKRVLSSVPTLFGVLTLVFLLIRVVPGDPALAILGDNASEQALQSFREQMGLNEPIWKQYLSFLGELAKGSLGNSMVTGDPVFGTVLKVLPHTLQLTIFALFIGVIFGVPLGIWSAIRRDSWVDYTCRVVSLVGISFPSFLIAIVLILLFAIEIPLFPVISNPDGTFGSNIYNLVLPGMSLGLIMTAFVMRTARSSYLNVSSEDYIRTAKSKGTPRRIIILRHALRNALIPIVTVVGLYMGLLIGNSVLTEIVFNRPGLGKLIVLSLNLRDYATLQGLMIVYAFMVVLVNLLTDLTYGLFDPRVTYS